MKNRNCRKDVEKWQSVIVSVYLIKSIDISMITRQKMENEFNDKHEENR